MNGPFDPNKWRICQNQLNMTNSLDIMVQVHLLYDLDL